MNEYLNLSTYEVFKSCLVNRDGSKLSNWNLVTALMLLGGLASAF